MVAPTMVLRPGVTNRPGVTVSGFQHAGGGGGGGGGSLTSPTSYATDPFSGSGPSWLFNGTNNGLSFDVNAWGLETTGYDWCVEGFFYRTDSNAFPRLFSIGAYPSASIAISLEGGTMYYWMNSGIVATTTNPANNTWNHFAISSFSGATYFYLNGAQVAAAGQTMPSITDGTVWLGCENGATGASDFGGYINGFRWTVGTGVYTASFTVPTSALELTQAGGGSILPITAGQVKLLTSGANHGSNTAVQSEANSGSNGVHIDASYSWGSTVPVGATIVADGVGTFTVTQIIAPNFSGNTNTWFFVVDPNNASFPGGTALTFTW